MRGAVKAVTMIAPRLIASTQSSPPTMNAAVRRPW
jgi:hypothetical protein